MSKHTPGPWTYEAVSQTVYGISEGGCNKTVEPFMIANVRGWGHLQYLPNGAEIQDANGRLLAAAPDLLEALENIVALSQNHNCYEFEAYSKALDAIAKAKGETP